MRWHHLFIASAWAGVIALDFTACGPFMVTQPLVCGPLFAWLLGQVGLGVIIGGIMQLLWMDLSPIGVGIPYDATATTLLAVYWSSLPGNSAISQIMLSLAVAVPFGFLFRWVDQMARRLNTVIMHRVLAVSDDQLALGLWFGVGAGVAWSWIRYAATYFAIFGLGEWFFRRLAYYPRMTMMDQGLTMTSILLPVAGMGVALELFLSEQPEGRWINRRQSKNRRQEDSK